MQTLFKPFLFAVARLGLFLAVVAWVIGQWWQGSGHMLGMSFAIDCDAIGVSIGRVSGTVVRRTANYSGVTEFLERPHGAAAGDKYISFSVAAFYIGPDWAMAIRHWFGAFTLLSFNLLLRFIYRKRPEAEPCED